MAGTGDEMTTTPVQRVVDALAAHGCNPRQAGPHQWTARCPVAENHKRGDRNPSLSLGESPIGNALLHCHAGCPTPAVAAALELHMADLFPPEAPRSTPATPLGTPKAEYPYHDADGEVLFRTVKYVGGDGRKTFVAQRPDGRGGWLNGAGGHRTIYQLPAVLAAVRDGRPVIICEGEKDAETATWAWSDVGGVGTCNPFGAGKWHADFNEHLRGATVHIVADDDGPGHIHADMVRVHLDGVAASVTSWLPAAPHKDLSEMVGAGRTRHDLRPFTVAPTASDEVVVDPVAAICVDWAEFWTLDHRNEEWAIEPLVPAGRSVALYAPAKTGKSLVVLSAVAAAVTGRSVWGLPPQAPVRALYLDYEMTAGDLRERLELLGYGPSDDLSGLAYALIPALPPLDSAEGGAKVLELAQAHGATVVVIDTFGRAAQGDENDADTSRAFYRHTGGLLKAAGIATLRTDHAGKDPDKGQRGSSAKNDDVDVVWRLDRLQGGVKLARTHSRVLWVPEGVVLDMHEDDDGVWRFTRQAGTVGWPEGTKETAAALDALGIPVDWSANAAIKALRAAGHKGQNATLKAAVKWRKQEADRCLLPVDKPVDNSGDHLGDHLSWKESGTMPGTTSPNGPLPGTGPPGDHRGPPPEPGGPRFPVSKTGTGTRPASAKRDDDVF